MALNFILVLCLLPAVLMAAENRSLGACITDNDNYRDWVFQNALPKTLAYFEQLLNSNFEMILPMINASKWDMYCRESDTIRTCITASNDPSEVEDKRKVLAVLDKIRGIICDTEIKAKFPCFLNISQHPSQECQTRCERYKASLLQAFEEVTNNGTTTSEKVKSICQFINCRTNCRKAEINAACGPTAFETTKKFLQAVAALTQTIHKEVPTSEAYPAECTPEGIVRETRRFF